jgi:enterochelin esterase-like enzyme
VTEDQVDTRGLVRFTFRSSTAKTVTVTGSWGPSYTDATSALRASHPGQWTTVIGPLAPGLYTYSFTVDDGMATADPRNPHVIHSNPALRAFLVPGPSANLLTRQGVPHGQVTLLTYQSNVTLSTRNATVWTPPGYTDSDHRYPTLYLFHGGKGDYLDWAQQGRANITLDNLLAAGKITPMVVVMGDGNVPGAIGLPQDDEFVPEVLDNLVPAVQRAYRVLPDAEHRALAGLSIGGLQTFNTLLTRPGTFGYVGDFSAGYFPSMIAEIRDSGLLTPSRVSAINTRTKLFRIYVGSKADVVYEDNNATRRLFDDYGTEYEFAGAYPEAGHAWKTWQHDLADFAPRIFT